MKGVPVQLRVRLIFWALIAGQFSGCATLNELRKTKNSGANDSAASSIVISRPGDTTPMISSISDTTWIQLRESKDSGRDRLNGLLATGAWQEATEEARRQLEKNPGDPSLLTALAAAYALGRNYEMASYYADVVLKANPSNADALNIVGLRLMMASKNRRLDFDDALGMFKKAQDIDGSHVAAALNAGYLQLDLGDAQAALESFEIGMRRCGYCFDAEYGYGLAAMRSGNWDQAKKSFESTLSRDKTKAAAQFQLAIVMYSGLNDQKNAIAKLQEVVSDPDGRFKNSGAVKRAANVTLRRWRAGDRSGPIPEEITQPPTGRNSGD